MTRQHDEATRCAADEEFEAAATRPSSPPAPVGVEGQDTPYKSVEPMQYGSAHDASISTQILVEESYRYARTTSKCRQDVPAPERVDFAARKVRSRRLLSPDSEAVITHRAPLVQFSRPTASFKATGDPRHYVLFHLRKSKTLFLEKEHLRNLQGMIPLVSGLVKDE